MLKVRFGCYDTELNNLILIILDKEKNGYVARDQLLYALYI